MNNFDRIAISDSKFEAIRTKCRAKKILFEDPDFPASLDSIYHSRSVENNLTTYTFKWMRPSEICKFYGFQPAFFLDGGSRFDLIQGEIGNCWVVASAACLSENSRLLERVVPKNQSFSSDWYAGVFHFNFWQYGRWIEVVIDDRLPTVHGRLMFVHSNHINEFWGALLEKAFAKLHGSYEFLRGGTNADALTDFTGGLVETYFLRQPPLHFDRLLHKAFERRSLVAASIYGSTRNDVLSSGLVVGHAYSVTGIQKLDLNGKPVHLVRIRNPWGNYVEWKGPWGDNSREWKTLSVEARTQMKLIRRSDGEFWMDLKDFVNNFDSVEICNLTGDALLDPPKTWSVSITHSQWEGDTAGGSIRFPTFWKNPQVHVRVEDHDEDDDQLASFTVELMHKQSRKERDVAMTELTIGFMVFRIGRYTPLPLKKDYFNHSSLVGMSDFYVTGRTVTKRFNLPPGDFIIVPTTWEPNQETGFCLRIFSEAKHSTVLNDSTEVNEIDGSRNVTDSASYALHKYFHSFAGKDKAADSFELKKLLDFVLHYEKYSHLQFKWSTCKYLLVLMDLDYSNKLEFQEFLQLWFKLKEWVKTFVHFDTENNGVITAEHFEKSLTLLGYNFDQGMMNKIVFRYSDLNKRISFNSFIKCVAKLHMSLFRFRRDLFYETGTSHIVNTWLNSLMIL